MCVKTEQYIALNPMRTQNMQNCWLKLPRNGSVFDSYRSMIIKFQTFVLCSVTAAAFVPTTAVEEALQKSYGKLRECLTQTIVYGPSSHTMPTGKIVRGFTPH